MSIENSEYEHKAVNSFTTKTLYTDTGEVLIKAQRMIEEMLPPDAPLEGTDRPARFTVIAEFGEPVEIEETPEETP